MNSHNFMQVLTNPPRCECHECTQARWKMSGLQGQLQQTITVSSMPAADINSENGAYLKSAPTEC